MGALLALAFAGVSACREPARSAPSKARPTAAPSSPAALSMASPSASAPPSASVAPKADSPVDRTLVELRARMLSLGAPEQAPRRVAFGRGFVLQAAEDAVRVLDSTTGAEVLHRPVTNPRATLPLPSGSVLLAASESSWRFDPHQKVPHRLNRITFFPGAELVANPPRVDSVWLVHTPLRRLLRFGLSADAGLGLETEIEVPDYDGQAFTQLRDGRFLFTSARRLVVLRPGARAQRLELDGPPGVVIWRMVAAERIDRAWVVTRSGQASLVELGVRATVKANIELAGQPFDVASTPTRLLLLTVTPRDGRFWFRLSAYSHEAKPLWSIELPSVRPGAAHDWAVEIIQNRQLVMADQPPRVAVGGPSSLEVFNAESGARLFGR